MIRDSLPLPASSTTSTSDQVTAKTDRLHHIGFIVPSISSAVEGFISTFQMDWDGEIFHDPTQTVRVTFLRHRSPGMPMIELVEPDSPSSRVVGFVKKHSSGLHHLCYEVDLLQDRLEKVLIAGAILVSEPKPAVAFNGRPIAWIYTREKMLVEFLQH